MADESTSKVREPHEEEPSVPLEPAALHARQSTLRDLVAFLRERRKLWMVPLLTVLLVLALMISLSSTVLAPFIYTLF